MKILLTGATGYIGKRLLTVLLNQGHEITACVRDKNRLQIKDSHIELLKVIEVDFSKKPTDLLLEKHDVAFYLLHSMTLNNNEDFEVLESETAINFKSFIEKANINQVIYLSGIVHETGLSKHLRSRKKVENILQSGDFALTVLSAGIIVGSGSSSFEIIRDLCEKLPLMVCPKWVNTRTQPIAARDVMKFLTGCMLNEQTYNRNFDIGGPEVLSYKEMMLIYGKVRKIKPLIITVPVLTPTLSSYWLYFVTATNYRLAKSLVSSMTCETICKNNDLQQILNIETIPYKKSIENAFESIEQNMVISSWKDSFVSSDTDKNILNYINVPKFGIFKDLRKIEVYKNHDLIMQNVWSIGGKKGWYFATWLWRIRGLVDKFFGGVGLRRGRTNPLTINTGDALDFWRVILADREGKRLILYAEMKLPGEAWLEFKIENNVFSQQATFRPKGLLGRLYWFALLPFHALIFKNMAKRICSY